ncbi:MAG TPA: endonuclease/exonuclease/phosphatase family protein [Pirellulales bacterium]|nr:endonuclease/exonuclease/phosphatase family protein [Pirellulales bacterium]
MRTSSKANLLFVLVSMGGFVAVLNLQPSKPLTVRVLTYNTHLLPRLAEAFASHRGRGDYRAETIGHRIAEHDLVGLCEVFDPTYRDSLIRSAQAATDGKFHVFWTKKPRGIGFANSGLLLLSVFAIEASHSITYTSASGFATEGFRADGFAAKGAIHARLRVRENPPLELDCFLTHLESRSDTARAAQLWQLAEFMRMHVSARRPALLMGDLNVRADSASSGDQRSPYLQLVAALAGAGIEWIDVWSDAGRGADGTSDPLAEDGGHRIDYIWLSPPPTGRSSPLVRDIEVLRFLDTTVPGGSLSDHSGVACIMELQ